VAVTVELDDYLRGNAQGYIVSLKTWGQGTIHKSRDTPMIGQINEDFE
jgi:hypothetical protein